MIVSARGMFRMVSVLETEDDRTLSAFAIALCDNPRLLRAAIISSSSVRICFSTSEFSTRTISGLDGLCGFDTKFTNRFGGEFLAAGKHVHG